MEVKAKAKHIRISPKKVRLVAGVIRGVDVNEGLVKLKFLNKAAALPMLKLLKSAIANAEENFKLDKDNLFVKEIKVDEGVTLKRWMPRAFGRATPLRKRASHIDLTLAEKVPTDEKKIEAIKKEKRSDKKDDLVKLGDVDELKDVEKQVKSDKSKVAEKTTAKSSKGFAGKIFNRKSGDK